MAMTSVSTGMDDAPADECSSHASLSRQPLSEAAPEHLR